MRIRAYCISNLSISTYAEAASITVKICLEQKKTPQTLVRGVFIRFRSKKLELEVHTCEDRTRCVIQRRERVTVT